MLFQRRRILLALLIFSTVAPLASAIAPERVERNVIYGMYSGTALLMDIHYPATPKGAGVVMIGGSGWTRPAGYSSPNLKEGSGVVDSASRFTEAGFTVFIINHRAAPEFRYPAAVEDAQRAVRFIRHNAAMYGINPERLCGWGMSSGGHLVSLLEPWTIMVTQTTQTL